MQLRTTVRRVAVGAGPARKPDLLAAVRALPGLPDDAVGDHTDGWDHYLDRLAVVATGG